MTEEMPSDYDPEDSTTDGGLDKCARCDDLWRAYSSETVYDSAGRKYDRILDTDRGDAPFFCSDCWQALETNVKASENKSLTEFSQ